MKEFCRNNKICIDKICITGSSVLSLYNLRDCTSIDLFIDKSYVETFKKSIFKNYNSFTLKNHFIFNFEDIIFNPNNFFIFQNFKFCNLNLIKYNKEYCIKYNILNDKSKNDLKLINTINYK